MPTIDIVKTSPLKNTYRVAKVQGMFDVARTTETRFELHAELPLDEHEWKIGLITGASGTGKSTIANTLWDNVTNAGQYEWRNPSLVDDFPEGMTPTEITTLLNAVGFSSTPAWLRPYHALSTGQQFRADLARALAEAETDNVTIFDEFTSTVDRTVAKAAAYATQKHIRRAGTRFVAVTCHEDVEEWLQPDWVYNTTTSTFRWECKRRPDILLDIREGGREYWPIFRPHHYMSGDLSKAARVFTAWVTLGDEKERLAGFFSILPSMGHKGWRRGHRTVVLPDFQGLGIGNRMIETVAEQLYRRERLRFRATTSSPALVQHRLRKPTMWRLASAPHRAPIPGKSSHYTAHNKQTVATGRLTTSWVYVPEELRNS